MNETQATTNHAPHMLSIRAAAKEYGLPEYALRCWVKCGKVHAVYAGSKALVNCNQLVDFLRGERHADDN